MRDTVGAVLRAGENQHAVEIGALEQRHEQIELLLGRDRDKPHGSPSRPANAARRFPPSPVRAKPRRRAARSRAATWPKKGASAGPWKFVPQSACTSGRKPMSSMRSTSSSTRIFTSRKFIARCSRRSSSRPGVAHDDVDAAGRFILLLSVADTAVHDRDAQIGKAPVIAKRGLHLRRELARRLEHETAKVAVLASRVRSAARRPRSCRCRSAQCRLSPCRKE